MDCPTSLTEWQLWRSENMQKYIVLHLNVDITNISHDHGTMCTDIVDIIHRKGVPALWK
jgi:hypothetical protein